MGPFFPIQMHNPLLVIASLLMISCNSFHDLAGTTRIGNDEQYVTVQNTDLNVRTRTFGDISFAFSNKEFKELTNSRPEFKDILFYGTTDKPPYEYYVLVDPEFEELDTKGYDIKDTLIAQNRIVLLIASSAPESDKAFILGNIRSTE